MRSMRRTASAACVVVALVAAGCGSDPEGSPPVDPATPSEASGSPAEPSESSSPSVEPASGPQIRHGVYSVRLPQGYELMGDAGMTKSGYDPALPGLATLSEIGNFEGADLESVAADSSHEQAWDQAPQRLNDVEIDGVPAYHLQGTSGGDAMDEFGALYQGTFARLVFTVRVGGEKRERAIASILASWEWA